MADSEDYDVLRFGIDGIVYGGNNLYIDNVSIESDYSLTTPGFLRVDQILSDQIVLSWFEESVNETGFIIERSSDGVDFVEVGRVGRNINTFADTSIPVPNANYFYRVRAFNSRTESDFTDVLSVQTVTAIEDFENEEGIRYYPNPIGEDRTLNVIINDGRDVNYIIYDIHGRAKLQGGLSGASTAIDLESLSPGVYFINISNNVLTNSIKFIVQ